MKVELIHNTPLWVCSTAIRKCWASEDRSDTITPESIYDGFDLMCGEKDKELIDRVGNKNKHSSTLEHLNYTFDIDGISRALLQELVRHRHVSYSVKSSRYTLKELKEDNREGFEDTYIVLTGDMGVDNSSRVAIGNLQYQLQQGTSNDIAKYCLPEAYKTSLVMTVNARSLQNLLQLRTSPSALKEFQLLAKELFNNLPEEHKYLFEDNLYKKDTK